jgi:hypothetical protein
MQDTHTKGSMLSVQYFCRVLTNAEVCKRSLMKLHNTKLRDVTLSSSEVDIGGQAGKETLFTFLAYRHEHAKSK